MMAAPKLSYAHTPQTGELYYKSNVDMLKKWAELYPNKEAFVEYDIKGTRSALTCESTFSESATLATFLVKSGIKKGDVIVVIMKNSLKLVISMFGIQLAGAIPTSYSRNMADGSDVIQISENANAKLLVIDDELESSCFQHFITENTLPKGLIGIIFINDQSKFMLFDIRNKLLMEIQHKSYDPEVLPSVLPEDTAVYFATSGSTGKPKLVEHSHMTWLNNSRWLNDVTMTDETSRFFCDRPLGWGAGSCRTYLSCGATRIFIDTGAVREQNRIDLIADIICKERCTHVYLPVYLVHDVINCSNLESSFSSVNTIITAGERITKKYQNLLGPFCKKFVVWYGSTELSGVSTFFSDNREDYMDGIIGKPMPGVEMKLVNDRGDVVPRGERGELLVRSVYRFQGYLGMKEKFQETVDTKNWIQTDDVGVMTEDGNFILEGRKCEVISVGSTKIYPVDIEKVLMNVPEVAKAIVVPVPDERLSNAVCACVLLNKFAANIDVESHFQKYWMDHTTNKPKYFLPFEEFPFQSTGKIDRKQITRDAIARLNLL